MIPVPDIARQLTEYRKFHIAFLGDSIVSAEWIHPNWRDIVEYVLKVELENTPPDYRLSSWGIRTFNAGFDGATSRDLRERLDADVLVHQPDMALYIVGNNDKYFPEVQRERRRNIEYIVSALHTRVPRVVVSTDIATGNIDENKRIRENIAMWSDLFPRDGVQLIDLFSYMEKQELDRVFTFVSSGNSVAGIKPGDIDFLHPSQYGNGLMAQFFLKEIFGIDFDPNRYLREVSEGRMFPQYQEPRRP